jgi:hypothetical protein
MSVRSKRRLMDGLSAGFLAATVGAVSYGLQSPEINAQTNKVVLAASGQENSGAIPDKIEQLLAATTTRLQRPLYDPPKSRTVRKMARPVPPAIPTPKPVAPGVDLQLLGTIVEFDRSLAIVADATGAIDQKRIGDTLDLRPPGIVIEAIQSGEVVVSHRGKRLTFRIAADSSTSTTKPAGKSRNRNKQRRKDR